jgi:hypothetical protein
VLRPRRRHSLDHDDDEDFGQHWMALRKSVVYGVVDNVLSKDADDLLPTRRTRIWNPAVSTSLNGELPLHIDIASPTCRTVRGSSLLMSLSTSRRRRRHTSDDVYDTSCKRGGLVFGRNLTVAPMSSTSPPSPSPARWISLNKSDVSALFESTKTFKWKSNLMHRAQIDADCDVT